MSGKPGQAPPEPDEDEYDEEDRLQYPDSVVLDGSSGLTVVADSIEEFLYRWWIETEIALRVSAGAPLTEVMSHYQEDLRCG